MKSYIFCKRKIECHTKEGKNEWRENSRSSIVMVFYFDMRCYYCVFGVFNFIFIFKIKWINYIYLF